MRMRQSFVLAAFAATLALATAASAKPAMSGEQKLAKILEGRVAGEPVNCITTFPSSDMQTIDRTAYVFGNGSVIYVNRTRDPGLIDDNNVLVIRRFGAGTQICRTDVITTMDRSNHSYTGNVFLGEFVPYRRAK